MKIRYKVEIPLEVDTDEFPVPADGRLSLSVKDEIRDILEGSIAATLGPIKITKVGTRDAEVRDYDND